MQGVLENLLSRGLLSEETLRMLTGQQPVPTRSNDPALMSSNPPPALYGMRDVNGEGAYPNNPTPVPLMVQAMNNGGVPTAPVVETQTPAIAPSIGTSAQPAAPSAAHMSGFDKFAKALEIAGRGFTIAGSKDPAATYAAFSEMDKPKVTPLAGGAFSMVTKPDGTQQIVKNDEIAKYLSEQGDLKKAFELLKIDRRGEVEKDVQGTKLSNNELVKAAGGVDAPVEFRPEVQNNIDKLNKLATTIPEIDKVAGTSSPMAANIIDRTYGRAAGSEAYSARRDLDSFIGKSVLDAAQEMKGALSDADVKFLKSIQPLSDDPTERKVRYVKEFAEALKRGEEQRMRSAQELRTRGVVKERQDAPSSPSQTSQPSTGGMTIPGLSEKASKYFK